MRGMLDFLRNLPYQNRRAYSDKQPERKAQTKQETYFHFV